MDLKIRKTNSDYNGNTSSTHFLWPTSANRVYAASLFRFLNHTHPVGLPWKCNQLFAETATEGNAQQTQQTNIHALSRILNHAASNQVAADLRLNPLKPELNPICYLLALLGVHHFLHVSRIRVKLLTLRWLMSYIYGAPILDVSRSHTTTQHSR